MRVLLFSDPNFTEIATYMTLTHAKIFLEMQEKDINQLFPGKTIHSTFLAMHSRRRARI